MSIPGEPSSSPLLAARFCRALHTLGATGEGGATFADLVRRWREPHRHYHTLVHLEACLAWLDWVAASADNAAEVELALWFHDAIYEPARADNERASAALAETQLRRLGVPEPSVLRVVQHVLATRGHRARSADGALVVDLDLSVLGASPEAYDRYERAIREEYRHVPDVAYRRGRGAVLREFAARPRIYETPALHELLEPQARRNLERALATLTEGGAE